MNDKNMSDQPTSNSSADDSAIRALYKRAAVELLHAYQRNKEAFRYHEAGAYGAAQHQAKISKSHSFSAHENLKEAIHKSEKMHPYGTLPGKIHHWDSSRRESD
jgi:hypothetical protein